MGIKLLLILSDEEIILYEGKNKTIYSFEKGVESIQTELRALFSHRPKVPLCLFVDRQHQDIREETLPSLLPWDRMRLLFHKRGVWASIGGFYGYRCFKQEGKVYLQWAHISQNDSLVLWLSWVQSLDNPFEGVFFIPLEAGNFLKKHCVPSSEYQMLIYKISSQKVRHVVFQGRRLLLFRSLVGEEDLRTSLHFLSRTYPDIHEKLQILSLIKDISLTLTNGTTSADPHVFIDFLRSQKGASLPLNINPSSRSVWMEWAVGILLVSSSMVIGIMVYQGIHYKREAQNLLSKIAALNLQTDHQKTLLKNQNVPRLRMALDHYVQLNPERKNPLKILQKLSTTLRGHHLRLECFTWNNERDESLEISFFLNDSQDNLLEDHFKALLSDLSESFPQADIHVIEGPFKSGSHETYTYPLDIVLPMARLRILWP